MLMGEYSHSLDAKGRLIFPAKLREQMGDKFVISKGLDGCLFAFPPEEWEKLETKLMKLPLTNKEARKFSRYLLAGAIEAELDKQGRVLLPQNLREAAALERDVVLCGVGSRVEIWDRGRWLTCSGYEDVDEIADNMADLGI